MLAITAAAAGPAVEQRSLVCCDPAGITRVPSEECYWGWLVLCMQQLLHGTRICCMDCSCCTRGRSCSWLYAVGGSSGFIVHLLAVLLSHVSHSITCWDSSHALLWQVRRRQGGSSCSNKCFKACQDRMHAHLAALCLAAAYAKGCAAPGGVSCVSTWLGSRSALLHCVGMCHVCYFAEKL